MLQDRVLFEEKLKRGLVPDGEGGWLTIEDAILKEKARHRQSRLWETNEASRPVKQKVDKPQEKTFFEKNDDTAKEIIEDETDIFDVDPIEDTAVSTFDESEKVADDIMVEVDVHDSDEDTAIHEIVEEERKAPETTIIETKISSNTDEIFGVNEDDTVVLDRAEFMRDVEVESETKVTSKSELDGISEDFGNIIDSFASTDTKKDDKVESTLNIQSPSKKNEEIDLELPPASLELEEVAVNDKSEIKNNLDDNDVQLDDWENSNNSIMSKIMIPAILVISAAALVATILIVT